MVSLYTSLSAAEDGDADVDADGKGGEGEGRMAVDVETCRVGIRDIQFSGMMSDRIVDNKEGRGRQGKVRRRRERRGEERVEGDGDGEGEGEGEGFTVMLISFFDFFIFDSPLVLHLFI